MHLLQIEFGTPEYDEAVRLRHEVLRQPLGLVYSTEQLASEYDQVHLAAYTSSHLLLGYLNLTPLDAATIKMRQVAVSPDIQNQGVGTALVAEAEAWAQWRGFRHMVLHARETAVPFYLRLGYAVIGERFEEVMIPHFRMEKELPQRKHMPNP